MSVPPADAPAPAAILDRLTKLYPRGIDLSLDRMRGLMADLGSPERRLPPVVHVAGTNGKGSLVAYLKAMFEAAGLVPHVYTSPHLVRFNERIAPGGRIIEDGPLADLLSRVEAVNGDRPITFFEITTAAAFTVFAESPADVTLLEVGLGGRLDATNLIDHPALTAITPVDLDHRDFLGDTVAEIAAEKAGIIKPGAPLIVGRQSPEAAAVIDQVAAALGAPIERLGREWRVARDPAGFRFSDARGESLFPHPGLAGAHQYDNAAMAVAAARRLADRFPALDDAAIARGLERVVWPARLQRLRRGPLFDHLTPDTELWLDGGHNPHAGQALARSVAAWTDRPTDLVVAMRDTKDAVGFLRPLKAVTRRLVTVTVPGDPRALSARELAEEAVRLGFDAVAAPSLTRALDHLRTANAGAPSRVLMCGTLFLAGIVLADHG